MYPGKKTTVLITSLLAGASLLCAGDDSTTTSAPTTATASSTSQNDEIQRLKTALAEQEKQLQSLQQSMKTQQELLEKAMATQQTNTNTNATATAAPSTFHNVGQVASTTPLIPVAPLPIEKSLPPISLSPAASAQPAAYPLPQGNSSSGTTGNPCEAPAPAGGTVVPAYIRLGNICVVPIGFMDFTPFWRSKAAATGTMGSNFGSVPYNNTVQGNESEYHMSLQNSRLGFRIDGDWKGTHFIGYNEFDFNGTGGATNYGVTNGAIVPRLRLYWIDVRKGPVEFLAGQSWSMMVPSRVGIAALPGDLFYGQEIDINYIAGLTWTRQPGLRVLLHGASDKLTFGFSVEQGDQYGGGSGGGGAIVLPTALGGLIGSGSTAQIDEGQNVTLAGYLNQPTFNPDYIAKVAFDPTRRFHFEVGGIVSAWHLAYNLSPTGVLSLPSTGTYNLHQSTHGEALTFGVNAALLKNLRWVASGMYGDGEGRYLFGAAPDFIVRADGSLSALHADGYITGLETTVGKSLLYGYYSGDYIGRDVAIDTNGSLIGYGYHGSSNSQNRGIQEATFGINQTVWKDPRYGAINLMGQYEWLNRDPWYVAIGAPKEAHDSTLYFDIRYTLPGSMPNF